MKQRDNEWRQRRLPDITASRFGDILTEPSPRGVFTTGGSRGAWYVRGKNGGRVTFDFKRKADADERKAKMVAEWKKTAWSQTAETYLNEKLTELLTGQPHDTWGSDATDWGTANEPHAFEAAIPVISAMFFTPLLLPEGEFAYIHHATEPGIGCSPDGLIGDDGLAEIKCPYNCAKWVAAKRKGLILPPEYVPQVQGQLWVCGRKWCAFCYFDPRVAASGLDPLLWIRIERDNDYIDNVLAPRVIAFRDYLKAEHVAMVGKAPF